MAKFSFAIDRGGTFTDVYVRKSDGSEKVLKLLSENSHYLDAPTEGIRRILEKELNVKFPRGQPIDAQHIESIRMGTTVATNALLERKGEKVALAVTRGFPDLLHIGNQSRPRLFDLKIDIPRVLYDEVLEVDERVVLHRDDCRLFSIGQNFQTEHTELGEKIQIWKSIDEAELKAQLKAIFDKGIDSLAVLFLHSFKYPNHELIVERLAKQVGFKNVSLSSKVMPMIKAVPRGFTATADAYLTPVIQRYVTSFLKGFKNLHIQKLMFMQSDGGLAPVNSFFGSRAILSGPAGGVVGVASTAYHAAGTGAPVIGYDMGGTSTDVSRYDGHFEHVFETTTAGVTIQAPQVTIIEAPRVSGRGRAFFLDINTVAAGGGSKLFFRDGLFVVGPDSVGADPGPVCYKKGGDLAVTDANLVLGRILPENFPKIFGPNENESLDSKTTREKFEILTSQVNLFLQQSGEKTLTIAQVAQGFVDVANEGMCRPIKALTQAKGYDTSKHVLACFGGAGGQHACSIAKLLGIKKVFVHKYASILSAYGISLADVVHEAQEPLQMPYEQENFGIFSSKFERLSEKCVKKLSTDGLFDQSMIKFENYLNLRYDRTDCAIMCKSYENLDHAKNIPKLEKFLKSFQEDYQREFGFVIPERKIIVDDIRVRAIAKKLIGQRKFSTEITNEIPKPVKTVECYFKNAYVTTKLYELENLHPGHTVEGPALITEINRKLCILSTIVIEPDCSAFLTKDGNVEITINLIHQREQFDSNLVDPIQLSIFSHRFMSIAEQMGRVLQRTAISTNIKERLDFSCALFSEDGGLVANAPHIPVHLGSMQETVKFQLNLRKSDLKPGDSILCNDPNAGGTHLPDMTVITPVFCKNAVSPQFFVANRGHHADIGGTVPGSMPPNSVNLAQEGVCIKSFKIVENCIFNEEGVSELFMAPAKIPGCSGARNLPDNISDLRAQIAANQKGVNLMMELIDCYGLSTVQKYMNHIQANADLTVREMLKNYGRIAQIENGDSKLSFSDYMDDGTLIQLTISIDVEKGEAIFDFNGTGCEVYGNTNAPRAVAHAAVIYCLRCLVGREIPLNQGCLKPVTLMFPENSLINPSPESAVVGGNVLTSQRLVDVILGAFGVCAASQGCMNNLTFGDHSSGYYETVAGGAGAGPGYNGRSGIHTHMTNTRITDPEILEHRYPVVLKKFHLRKNSGGAGRWSGGDGVVREILFRKNLTLSVLCERRAFPPYGMRGGKNGKRGRNLLRFASGRIVSLGGKSSVPVSAGDIFILKTPGGGGWESEDSASSKNENLPANQHLIFKTCGSLHTYKQCQESS